MHVFFNRWQRKYIGRMLTFLLGVATALVVCWLLVQGVRAISFLQPVLIPLAIAAVLAFLLEPVVRAICAKTRWSRTIVVLLLMALIVLGIIGGGIWVVPRAYTGVVNTLHDLPDFMEKASDRLFAIANSAQNRIEGINKSLPAAPVPIGPLKVASPDGGGSDATKPPGAQPSPSPGAPQPGPENSQANPAAPQQGTPDAAQPPDSGEKKPAPGAPAKKTDNSGADLNKNGRLDIGDLQVWLKGQLPKLGQQAPALLQRVGEVLMTTLGGFMGGIGILLNAIIIPIYFFFLLTEARNISKVWADFLPLKDSQFKQEIVSTLGEINGYLIAFFRGQLIVSSIDATLITAGLWFFLHLNFSLLIGLLVLVLTFIPYLGIMICYVPALLIAVVQFGDWQHPLYVVAIMFGVQTLESTIIAPKIVGESTGLHPLTVIISVFAWELILGGPIGALLAVPLTASLKVIMRRYVWERARVRSRILPTAAVAPVLRAGDRDRFGDGDPDIQAVPEAVARPQAKPDAPAGAETAHPPSGTKD